MTTILAKFSDVQLDHSWVEKYRLPVVEGFHTQWNYYASIAVPLEEENFYKLEMPTEEDAQLLGSYIEYKIDYWKFGASYLDKLRSEPLDVDSVSTLSVGHVIGKGWQYRIGTPETKNFPAYNSSLKFHTLLELLNYREKELSGEQIKKEWTEWVISHN
jgi:hypothetical protein